MAETVRLSRVNKFSGGITLNDRDTASGVALNIEELDIINNIGFIQPEQVLSAESVIANGAFDYAFDGYNKKAFALGKDTSGTPVIQIWVATTGDSSTPANWASYFTSANAFDNAYQLPSMLYHVQTESGTLKRYLYYTGVRGGSSTALYRLGDITSGGTTEATTDTASTSMVLDGITTSIGTKLPIPRVALPSTGSIYFGHGQYVAEIDENGTFVQHAFTLPFGWNCIDFAGVGDRMYILASSDNSPMTSRIFIWDLVSADGADDIIQIPMGGASMIWNHNEVVRVWCIQNGVLKIFEMAGKIPTETNRLENVKNIDTAGTGFGAGSLYYPVLKQFSFMKDNAVHFGLFKTDKCGIYALTKFPSNVTPTLFLRHRFIPSGVTAYTGHRPLAATAFGPNIFTSYHNGSAYAHSRVMTLGTPNRSSDAVYESVYIDGTVPETPKEWFGFNLIARSMPASCSIKVDARVDSASSYDSTVSADSTMTLSSTNDQQATGQTADRFWNRLFTSIYGRAIQIKLSFTSATTTAAQLTMFSLLSRDGDII